MSDPARRLISFFCVAIMIVSLERPYFFVLTWIALVMYDNHNEMVATVGALFGNIFTL